MVQMEAYAQFLMLLHTSQSRQGPVSSAEHVCIHHSVVLHEGKRSEVARACACTAAGEHSVCPAVLVNSAMLMQTLVQLCCHVDVGMV